MTEIDLSDALAKPKPKARKAKNPWASRRFRPAARSLSALTLAGHEAAIAVLLACCERPANPYCLRPYSDEIGELLGFDARIDYENHRAAKAALVRRLAELRRHTGSKPLDQLEANFAFVRQRLGLSDTEAALLRLAVIFDVQATAARVIKEINPSTTTVATEILGTVLLRPVGEIRRALQPGSILVDSGLLPLPAGRRAGLCLRDYLTVLDGVGRQLLEDDFQKAGMGTWHVTSVPKPELSLEAYPHLKQEAELIRSLLASAVERREAGVNILLHGPPGTGKTELARCLVEASVGSGYEVSGGCQEAMEAKVRLRTYCLAQHLLGQSKSVVVLDEVEELLSSDADFGYLMHGSEGGLNKGKAWKNKLLETNPLPTIWIGNAIYRIDPAIQRRFTYVLEVPVPPRSVRRSVLQPLAQEPHGRAEVLESLAEKDALTPADAERARRLLKLCPATSEDDWRQKVMLAIGSRPGGVETSALMQARPMPKMRYEPAWLNTSMSVDSLAERLAKSREARMSFSGPPGTGKTAFAQFLARQLDMPLITKKASDLLDMYVGGTEAKIAEAFRQSRAEKAVLMIDEADSFLRDRAAARHSWEVTQVNELLKQIEEHSGIVVFCTNAFASFDPAVLRRLDLKVNFDYLRSEQLPGVFSAACDSLGIPRAESEEFCARVPWRVLEGLALGDVAASVRQCCISTTSPTSRILWDAVAEQSGRRAALGSRRIGF